MVVRSVLGGTHTWNEENKIIHGKKNKKKNVYPITIINHAVYISDSKMVC